MFNGEWLIKENTVKRKIFLYICIIIVQTLFIDEKNISKKEEEEISKRNNLKEQISLLRLEKKITNTEIVDNYNNSSFSKIDNSQLSRYLNPLKQTQKSKKIEKIVLETIKKAIDKQ